MMTAYGTRRSLGPNFLGPDELRMLGFTEFNYPKNIKFEVPVPKRALKHRGRYTAFAMPELQLGTLLHQHAEYFQTSPHWEAVLDTEPTPSRWCLYDTEAREIKEPWEVTSLVEAAFFAIAYHKRHQRWPVEGVFYTTTPVTELNARYERCYACLGIVDGWPLRPVILCNGTVIVCGSIAALRLKR